MCCDCLVEFGVGLSESVLCGCIGVVCKSYFFV